MRTLSIIGAGRVGRTLGRLLFDTNQVRINSVYNRTIQRAKDSVDFIGRGTPISNISDVLPSDLYMITVPDHEIPSVSMELIKLRGGCLLSSSSVVFHCSGVTPSSVLKPIPDLPYVAVSCHPIKSFADPEIAIGDFSGTYCGIEGDKNGLEVMAEIFSGIGGIPFQIKTENKAMYHAATAMAANNLVALMEVATDMYEAAGLDREMSLNVIKPIVEGTIRNIFSVGSVKALTGPIARGDVSTITAHMEALRSTEYEAVYTSLGEWALRLAVAQNESSKDAQDRIAKLLRRTTKKEDNESSSHSPSMWKR